MSIRLQKFLTVAIALLTLAEWTLLGIVTPVIADMHRDFGITPSMFDWPYSYMMYLHWIWSVPVGVACAALLIWKDRKLSRRMAGIVNLVIVLGGVVLAALWVWGALPPRMMHYG